MRRARYQEGCLTRSARKSGDVWEFRFRERGADGKLHPRTLVVGKCAEIKTESAARRKVESIRVSLNTSQQSLSGPAMTFQVLSDHYSRLEMPTDDHTEKAFSTKDTNRGYLRKWILPRWKDTRIAEFRTIEVEDWLKKLPLAAGSRSKIKTIMAAMFRHAMRHEFMDKNPIQLVRCSSKRREAPTVLTADEVRAILKKLRLRERTMVLLDAGSGLRRGELFALKWQDVDFANKQVFVRHSIVKQVLGKLKTEASEKAMPLDEYMLQDLIAWYAQTPYKSDDDYVFATDANRAGAKRGKQPCWPNKVMDYWIKPQITAAGITKEVNWHTFRHTFSTLLKANGEDIKTVQELLRHANMRTTMDVYTQAIPEAKRQAQSKIVNAIAGNA